jgi:two-component system chemotaxis response regulator CheY
MPTTILIIEPRPSTRSILCRVLEDLERPAALLHADTTRAAADILEGVGVDVVFIDLGFAHGRGIHFVHGIRRGLYCDNRSLPIIAVAEARSGLFQQAHNAGVHAFLVSPFSRAAVALQLRRVRSDQRPFVASKSYVGPDRRREADQTYLGPERRAPKTDTANAEDTSHDTLYLP